MKTLTPEEEKQLAEISLLWDNFKPALERLLKVHETDPVIKSDIKVGMQCFGYQLKRLETLCFKTIPHRLIETNGKYQDIIKKRNNN